MLVKIDFGRLVNSGVVLRSVAIHLRPLNLREVTYWPAAELALAASFISRSFVNYSSCLGVFGIMVEFEEKSQRSHVFPECKISIMKRVSVRFRERQLLHAGDRGFVLPKEDVQYRERWRRERGYGQVPHLVLLLSGVRHV